MDIDYDKIKEIYGNDILSEIISNKEDIIKNLYYFYQLGFEDVEDIFERQVMIFICSNDEFINKINNLINKIGNNYIDEIENNILVIPQASNIPATQIIIFSISSKASSLYQEKLISTINSAITTIIINAVICSSLFSCKFSFNIIF